MKTEQKKLIVSFDFDGTLEFLDVQNYVKGLMDKEIEIHITTTRYEDPKRYLPVIVDHNDLYKIAKKLGIKTINFTNFEDKYIFLKDEDYLFHVDDDRIDLLLINHNTKIKGIDVLLSDWKEKCNKLIEKYNNTS